MQARGRGKFRFLVGRIWKTFDRQIHCFDRSMWKAGEKDVLIDGQPPRHWNRIMLIDPHDRNPHAVLWAALEADYKRIFLYREGWYPESSFSDTINRIKEEELAARES